ncbi:MAG: ATP synthase F0 subunit B [Candidatus Peribacteraceae bacterium]|nr:ATP synthase F0 subunit B [Candidatus Peribacteraceae bacterium]MDD5742180.1 ATP synthase F0 subunit B [Candidatus Peribacteraceae bacterium]
MELLTKLGINWQLLIAQIVNFLIVMGVLGYFLYRPILNLLDARAERIRKAVEEAKRIEHQAQEMAKLREEEMKRLDRESGEHFDRIRKEAAVLQEELHATAKKEAEAMIQNALKRIDEERRIMMEDIMKTVNAVIVRMTEKLLEREFTPADQKRIQEQLIAELPKMVR